ncbi:MAG: hypothetical protein ACOYY3_01845 [Chloroflexota bacterium]
MASWMDFSPPYPELGNVSRHTTGWIGETTRHVETWSAPPGILLKVSGGSDFYIGPGGESIRRVGDDRSPLSDLDREILFGPALVLALALRRNWSLHASAARFHGQTTVFLGDSGRGKSTLAAYLGDSGWQRVADDILPASLEPEGVRVWPRFPQLKLLPDQQPGLTLPEHLPLERICVLEDTEADAAPGLQLLPRGRAAQELIRHTAGTRLLGPGLLANHLAFCATVAGRVPAYRLAYPHRKDVLPEIKTMLESLC